MKIPRINSLRPVMFFLCIVLLSACDGGISGSSNGGGSPSPANGILIGYQIEHLPPAFAAALPAGLRATGAENSTNPVIPVTSVVDNIGEIATIYINLALVQLYTDALWPKIEGYCKDAMEDIGCELSAANLSFTYTRDMAIWESHARWQLANTSKEPVSWTMADLVLHESASKKIGNLIQIDQGTYRPLSTGEYDHEISLTLPGKEANGNTYQMLWDSDKSLVQTLTITGGSDGKKFFSSRYQSASMSAVETQNIILEINSDSVQNEFLLNLSRSADNPELLLESHSSRIEATGKTDIYSHGKADEVGGYLFSESNVEDSNSMSETVFYRELFGVDASLYSSAVCDYAQSSDDCVNQQDWTLVQGSEPTNSNYYTTPSELEAGLRATDIAIAGTRDDADTFILIRRDNLKFSLTSAGIEISVPGLGSFSWPQTESDLITQRLAELPSDIDSILLLKDLLCHVIPARTRASQPTRTFCTGSTEDIENALVISTSYIDGKFEIQWEANAQVTVLE